MNREESIKLLALIKVAYPTAYKDMDNASKQATVNMWQTTFPTVPFTIMEMAFNRFRMVSKFPPTVAEMCEELKHLHWKAIEDSMVDVSLGRKENLQVYEWIMEHTSQYRNDKYIDTPIYTSISKLTSGADKALLTEGRDNNGEND